MRSRCGSRPSCCCTSATRFVHEAIRPAVLGVLLLPAAVGDFALLWHPIGRPALQRSEKVAAWTVLPLMVAARCLVGFRWRAPIGNWPGAV